MWSLCHLHHSLCPSGLFLISMTFGILWVFLGNGSFLCLSFVSTGKHSFCFIAFFKNKLESFPDYVVFVSFLLLLFLEAEMTASILKQNPNTWKAKKNIYLIWQNTTCKFSGSAPFSSYKQDLYKQWEKTQISSLHFIFHHLIVKCCFVAWKMGLPWKFACCVLSN